MRLLAAAVAMACASCCRAPQPVPTEQQSMSPTPPNGIASPPPTATAATAAPRTGTVLFCAYGGQGVVPANAKPDAYYRVILLFEVTTPDASPTEAWPATSLVLEDAAGTPLAHMRALISAERAAHVALTGTWQSAMDDHGPPFDDRYAPGITRVRIEGWLDTRPATPAARVRVVLTGAGPPVELSGAVAGEWPTG
jgi:hypothetical protein